MRTTQHVEGIQLAYESPSQMMGALKAIAKKRRTVCKQAPSKDESIGNGAYLFEMHGGGLILCFSPDKWKSGGTVRISVPYIIVHGKKIPVPKELWAEEDDGTGEDTLWEFADKHWIADPEPPVKRKRKIKCLNGAFPKLLIDVVCTIDEMSAMGIPPDGLPDDVADYEIAVWLRKIVGDTVKSAEKYYEFLDSVRTASEASELNGMDYDSAVVEMEINHNKAHTLLQSRSLLLAPKEA